MSLAKLRSEFNRQEVVRNSWNLIHNELSDLRNILDEENNRVNNVENWYFQVLGKLNYLNHNNKNKKYYHVLNTFYKTFNNGNMHLAHNVLLLTVNRNI